MKKKATGKNRGGTLQLIQGTLDMLILQTLSQGPMHGYGVSSSIRRRSDGELALVDGALYQSLHRLERKRWVVADWGVSENGRRAKFYQLTKRGQEALHDGVETWQRYSRAVFRILEPQEG